MKELAIIAAAYLIPGAGVIYLILRWVDESNRWREEMRNQHELRHKDRSQ